GTRTRTGNTLSAPAGLASMTTTHWDQYWIQGSVIATRIAPTTAASRQPAQLARIRTNAGEILAKANRTTGHARPRIAARIAAPIRKSTLPAGNSPDPIGSQQTRRAP